MGQSSVNKRFLHKNDNLLLYIAYYLDLCTATNKLECSGWIQMTKHNITAAK